MRLPGTRYQEHGWEQVRKLLGRCSLAVLQQLDPLGERVRAVACAAAPDTARTADLLDLYVDAMAVALRLPQHLARRAAPGNSYGDTVGELASGLLFELRARPECWDGLCTALAAAQRRHGDAASGPAQGSTAASRDAMLRKNVNDMYAVLRDRVDADGYQAATGRPCSANRIYTYRMLDMAYRSIGEVFANWRHLPAQVAEILVRDVAAVAGAMPIEARQMTSIAACRAEWVIRWSATLERHGGAPGPLHTKSKRFSSLKHNPAAIAAMLEEIGGYETLSANRDALTPWRSDEEEAAAWLDDYARVIAESEAAEGRVQAGGTGEGDVDVEEPVADVLDQILATTLDAMDHGELAAGEWDGNNEGDSDGDPDSEPGTAAEDAALQDAMAEVEEGNLSGDPVGSPDGNAAADTDTDTALATSLSLPPRFMSAALAAQDAASWTVKVLHEVSLPVRLAVYHALLGAEDDTYPQEWLDPATGALPALHQLAALDRISMPTLRKRRAAAIELLQAASLEGTAYE